MICFFSKNWLVIAELRNLLRYNNASLQALRLPLSNDLSAMPEGGITALPHSLRSLHINAGPPNSNYPFMVAAKRDRVHALLDCAYVCCPKLAILMLPMEFPVNEQSLGMLAGFDKWVWWTFTHGIRIKKISYQWLNQSILELLDCSILWKQILHLIPY